MKLERHSKIIELIGQNVISTQEELAERLRLEGFAVTQATVSRDIRQLRLSKVSDQNGGQRYTATHRPDNCMSKYIHVLIEGFDSMDIAQNILVIKTVSGMAMAVAAALDALELGLIVGSIAGDDTVMCATRSEKDAHDLMMNINRMLHG